VGTECQTFSRPPSSAEHNSYPATLLSNLLLLARVLLHAMDLQFAVSAGANFFVIAGLILYGFRLFADYHERGKWAKNITGLLGGLGMLLLSFALLLTPHNAEIIDRLAETKASVELGWVSSGLLLIAIAAFGVITYTRPIRLWHERKIHRDLNRGLPKIP
jgi:hypothetical protein